MSKCQQPLNYFKSMRNNSLVLGITEDLERPVTQHFLFDYNRKHALQRGMICFLKNILCSECSAKLSCQLAVSSDSVKSSCNIGILILDVLLYWNKLTIPLWPIFSQAPTFENQTETNDPSHLISPSDLGCQGSCKGGMVKRKRK